MTEIIVGCAATAVVAIVAWIGKRIVGKIDQMDVVVRGDGNGRLGLGEKIRDVHAEVKTVGQSLDSHMKESVLWQGRIVGVETRLDLVESESE